MTSPKATPMMTQYLSIKAKYEDTILFYRMGDFYEMFFEDAETASKVLGITLTSRNKNSDGAIPMCGFPHRAADGYIAKLIESGHKVAICEQIEDPATAKGIVKRDVIRVVTPGMVFDENLLDEKSNNFVLALHLRKKKAGLAYLDVSTGTFRLTESEKIPSIIDEALRVSPSEIIISEALKDTPELAPFMEAFEDKYVSFFDDRSFEYKHCREKLIEKFKTRSLEGFGCESLEAGVCAAGAVLSYIQETQLKEITHVTRVESYFLDHHMIIDELSCRNLELLGNLRNGNRTGTLIGVIDQTVTAMGARQLKRWVRYPLITREDINLRLDAIGESLADPIARHTIRDLLKNVYDLERIGSKVAMGHCNARDLLALKKSLQALPDVMENLAGFNSSLFKTDVSIDKLMSLAETLELAIVEDPPHTLSDGGIFKIGYNPELSELITMSRDGKSWIAEIGAREKEQTKISSLKIKFNKVFGYFIEVSKAQSTEVPETYIRKQTLVNAERFITEELKELETKVLNAEDNRNKLEYTLFCELRDEVMKTGEAIFKMAEFLACIDGLLNLAHIAESNDYCRPEINTDGVINISEGRHPVVEKMISGERYVPNSVLLDNESNQVLVITGPNMAGKSTILRQVAILTLMAQIGSYVPAEKASICITDRIFTRVGALDNLSQGQSTFMVEMEETANIINNATGKSLVIMDEIGRGTSTFDGLSIAWAVAEHLHDLNQSGVKTMFATHYHELTKLSDTKSRVQNYNVAVKEWNDDIIFLRKMVLGSTNRSYGIQVARLAGLSDSIIKRSKSILSDIEKREQGLMDDPSATTNPKKNTKSEPKQLSLFSDGSNKLVEEILKIDVSNITPMDAINHLFKLREQAKNA